MTIKYSDHTLTTLVIIISRNKNYKVGTLALTIIIIIIIRLIESQNVTRLPRSWVRS